MGGEDQGVCACAEQGAGQGHTSKQAGSLKPRGLKRGGLEDPRGRLGSRGLRTWEGWCEIRRKGGGGGTRVSGGGGRGRDPTGLGNPRGREGLSRELRRKLVLGSAAVGGVPRRMEIS